MGGRIPCSSSRMNSFQAASGWRLSRAATRGCQAGLPPLLPPPLRFTAGFLPRGLSACAASTTW